MASASLLGAEKERKDNEKIARLDIDLSLFLSLSIGLIRGAWGGGGPPQPYSYVVFFLLYSNLVYLHVCAPP